MTTAKSKVRIKLVLLGDCNVGKTCIVRRYTKDTFSSDRVPTTEAGFNARRVEADGTLYILHIWDTAGEEQFGSILPMYLRDAKVALIVYDITAQSSFDKLNHWAAEVLNYAADSCQLVVLGNKSDLSEQRVVAAEDGAKFAMDHGALFQEISALTGAGINDAFTNIVKVLSRQTHALPRRNTIFLHKPPPKETSDNEEKRCCHRN